jgi:hypothetical protein
MCFIKRSLEKTVTRPTTLDGELPLSVQVNTDTKSLLNGGTQTGVLAKETIVRRGAAEQARAVLDGACCEQRREACKASSNPGVSLFDDEMEQWRTQDFISGYATLKFFVCNLVNHLQFDKTTFQFGK